MASLSGIRSIEKVRQLNYMYMYFKGYEFLYSKTYNTGKYTSESEKMVQFLLGIKSPSVILMVAEGDATSALTDDAWDMFVSRIF